MVPLSSSGMSASASNEEGSEASESAVVPGRGILLPVERHGAVRVVHRDQGPVEATLLDGDLGSTLGLRCELVDGTTVDLLERGDRVGGHTLVRLGVDGP